MRKRENVTLLRGAAVAVDTLLINLAFFLAYWLRYSLGLGGAVEEQYYVGLGTYARIQAATSGILLLILALYGLYRDPLRISLLDELIAISTGTSLGMMLTLALVFLFQGYAYSRGLFLFFWILTILFLGGARLIKGLIKTYLHRKGWWIQRVLVVGSENLGKMVMHVLATEPGLPYQLVGFVDTGGNGDMGRFPCLGALAQLPELIRTHHIDEVIIALPSASRHLIPSITQQCERVGLGFKIVPDLYEMSLSRVDVDDIRGIPLIGVKPVSIQGSNLFFKRAMDILVALVVLFLFLPLWLLIGLLIKLDSPGPVFFSQVRLGRGGRPFRVYKFRSMKTEAEEEMARLAALNEASGPWFKIRDDPRMTRVGRFLRRASLDEIPQFINVLKGEMSLVGPRPPIPSEVEQYQPWHRKRLEAAPGITGLWQVSGRSELPFDEMVMLDIYYIENWSLALDFKILLRTLPAVLSGHGAY